MLPCDSKARPSLKSFLASDEGGRTSTGKIVSDSKQNPGKTTVPLAVAMPVEPATTEEKNDLRLDATAAAVVDVEVAGDDRCWMVFVWEDEGVQAVASPTNNTNPAKKAHQVVWCILRTTEVLALQTA